MDVDFLFESRVSTHQPPTRAILLKLWRKCTVFVVVIVSFFIFVIFGFEMAIFVYCFRCFYVPLLCVCLIVRGLGSSGVAPLVPPQQTNVVPKRLTQHLHRRVLPKNILLKLIIVGPSGALFAAHRSRSAGAHILLLTTRS